MTADYPRPLITTLDRPRPAGAYFDAEAADRAVAFFSTFLSHVKGRWAGQPFRLEPWEEFEVIRPLFGWKGADGLRLYREAFVFVPRKNGKTTLSAGIGGLLLYADGEPGAEVYSAAVDREQAALVFEALREMVLASPALSERSQVFRRSIVVPEPHRASYKVLSADVPNKLGLSASGVIVDELAFHADRGLFDVLATSTGARTQPLVVSITTAGVYTPGSIFDEKLTYARQVAAGIVEDPAFLGVLYMAEPGDDWQDEATWRKANPNLDVSLSLEYLRREASKARASVAAQNTFRMLHLNEVVQQATRWIDLAAWDASAGSVIEPDLAGRTCYGGLDLASVSDLTALVWVFPMDSGEVKILGRYFVPERQLHEGPNRELYRQFANTGRLTVTPGNATDYAWVRERIVRDAGKFAVENLNIDYLFQGGQLAGELIDLGLPVAAMRQGFLTYALPMAKLEELLLRAALHHGGDAVLRWAADNVVVRSDPAGNLRPDKERSRAKIDPIVALVMALEPLTRQVYAGDPGVAVF